MPVNDHPQSSRAWISGILLAVICAMIGVLLFWKARYSINPDGIAYIERAKALAEGRFTDAISGYWAPGLPWVIAAFIRCGASPLNAAHLAQFCALVVYTFAVWVFVTRTAQLCSPWREGIVVLAVLYAASRVGAALVTPDLLAAGPLLFLIHMVFPPGRPHSPGKVITAGILGGLCYVTRYFYLPWFVAYWFGTCALQFARARTAMERRASCTSWVIGMAGFAATAGIWVSILSLHDGHLTFSNHSKFNFFLGSPVSDIHSVHSLQEPEQGRLTIWETPERLQFPSWEPWKSPAQLIAHLRTSVARLQIAVTEMARLDLLYLTSGLVVVGLLWRAGRDGCVRQSLCLVAIAVFGLSAAGYSAIYLTQRDFPRFVGVTAVPIILAAVARIAEEWSSQVLVESSIRTRVIRNLLHGSVFAGWLILYGIPIATQAKVAYSAAPSYEFSALHAGARLHEMGAVGPVACAGSWRRGLYCSWHAGFVFLGELDKQLGWEESVEPLARLGCQTLLLERGDDEKFLRPALASGNWVHRGELLVEEVEYEVLGRK